MRDRTPNSETLVWSFAKLKLMSDFVAAITRFVVVALIAAMCVSSALAATSPKSAIFLWIPTTVVIGYGAVYAAMIMLTVGEAFDVLVLQIFRLVGTPEDTPRTVISVVVSTVAFFVCGFTIYVAFGTTMMTLAKFVWREIDTNAQAAIAVKQVMGLIGL